VLVQWTTHDASLANNRQIGIGVSRAIFFTLSPLGMSQRSLSVNGTATTAGAKIVVKSEVRSCYGYVFGFGLLE